MYFLNYLTSLVSHSRVSLKYNMLNKNNESPNPNENEFNYYINANYINTFVRGYGEKAFIAT